MRNREATSRCALAAAITLVLTAATTLTPAQMRGSRMAVIAPSTSTRDVARSALRENGWTEVKPKQADGVLVVVRSSMHDPLFTSSRACFCDLRRNAERQPNLSGSKVHIYVYRLNDDLTVTKLRHTSRDTR